MRLTYDRVINTLDGDLHVVTQSLDHPLAAAKSCFKGELPPVWMGLHLDNCGYEVQL